MTKLCHSYLTKLSKLVKIILLILVPVQMSLQAQNRIEAGKPLIRNYSAREYGAHVQNWAVVQDSRGLIYFANGSGVMEYDGVSWRLIRMPNKYSAYSLDMDNSGRIYVGAIGDLGYLAPDSIGQIRFVSLLEHIPPADRAYVDIRQTHVTPHGVFFRSTTRLFLWTDDGIRERSGPMKVWKSSTRFLRSGIFRDRLILHQWERGLMQMAGDSLQLVPDGGRFAEEEITALLQIDNDRFLIGTSSQGLLLYDGASFKPFRTAADDYLYQNHINHCALLPDGSFAFATRRGGVVIVDQQGHILQRIDKGTGLLTNIVLFVFVDHQGALWLAMDSGIARVETNSPLSFFDEQSGITSYVYSILRHKGTLYAVTGLGVSYLDTKQQKFRPVSGITATSWSLVSMGEILLAATSEGLYQIKNNQATFVKKSIGRSFNTAFLYRSRQDTNRVYVGLFDGLASLRMNQGKWIDEGRIQEVNESIRRIVESDDGRLWLGTDAMGVLRVDLSDRQNPNVERFGPEHGLPKGGVGVHPVAGGIHFTMMDGIFRFDEKTKHFRPDSTIEYMFSDGIRDIVKIAEDEQGNAWLASSEAGEIGVALRQPDGSYVWDRTPFLGIPRVPIWDIYTDPDGIVWFGTEEGLVRYDSKIKKDYAADFPILIRRVIAGEESVIYGGGVFLFDAKEEKTASLLRRAIVPYSHNALRFEFATPSYEASTENQFQTFLEGFDKGWSQWSKESKKDYTNLPEGDYRFRVRAKNVYGHVSSEASYELELHAPWYRTWWAYILYVLAAAGFVVGVVRIRTHQLQARHRELEKTVEERTSELRQRVGELAVINSVQEGLVAQIDIQAIYDLVGNRICDLFDTHSVIIRTFDHETGLEHWQFAYEKGKRLDSKPRPFIWANREMIRTRQPLIIHENYTETARKFGGTGVTVGEPPKSAVFVPMIVGKTVQGSISLQNVDREHAFSDSDVRLLTTFANGMTIALEKARLFAEAQQARAVAEDANEAKSRFLSTVSHELRTPLTSVLGFAKIIRKRLEEKIFPLLERNDEKTQRTVNQVAENLNVIVTEGERLTSLINNVLDLAKIEAGKYEWQQEPVAVAEIIERASAATAALFEGKDLQLVKHIEGPLPEIVGDRDKLIQVLINLFSNAVKFTGSGSVTCRATHQDGEVIVSVTDTGIGITPSDQQKVFEKFKQVGDTLTDKPKGTGLGLPICKEIVEHHGGRIWVESAPGQGSTFSFVLPVKKEPQPPSLDALMKQLKERVVTTTPRTSKEQPTILAVDDDAHIRELLKQELTEAGYSVRLAQDGRDALEQVRNQRPDLIILDVMMPEMNGFDVAAVLKNDPETMDIPIIILSIVQDKERGYRLGVDRYLTKPIDTGTLFKEIDTLLAQGKSKKKVMVVDEDASTVKTLTEVLQARGYSVLEANGPELVQKAVSEKPDIIILNSVLSQKQELVKTLRFEKGLEDVLFVVYQ